MKFEAEWLLVDGAGNNWRAIGSGKNNGSGNGITNFALGVSRRSSEHDESKQACSDSGNFHNVSTDIVNLIIPYDARTL
ncbi:MAG: hypothetical protein M3Y65_10485 [Pseudomonadota bacterium]|nr:hypothetical protein [Pseudomonadota bacterium]